MASILHSIRRHDILLLISLLALLFPALTSARPRQKSALYKRQSSVETACNDIFNSDFGLFTAETVHNCLISTPFNTTVATQFLSYYRDTLQFQSTLTYLKNPPATYRQPPVDLLGGLDTIQQAVNNGVYMNEYDFEVAVQKLIYSAHDAHISLYAGVLSVFSFGAPVSIVSVSSDGIALPKIFILDDLLESGDPSNKAEWTPSAITSINGVQIEEFLKNFAASNSLGTLEPNADWNQLMSSPANDVQGLLSAFEGSTPFWPGNEITFAFENGTTPLTLTWLATYSIPEDTPKITSGNDLYKVFVLGDFTNVDYNSATSAFPTATAAATSSGLPFSGSTSTATPANDTSAAVAGSSSTAAATAAPAQATSWEYFPYPPNPVTVQPNLGDGGVVTGYFLNDGVTAVLSIPSFDINDEAIISFSTTIGDFIQKSKDAQKERFIIDLQRNGGGGNLLAIDTFKQFFPAVDPFGGSRLRAHNTANVLGSTISTFFDNSNATVREELVGSAWTASTFINADTGRNFSSWAELYGPHAYNGDLFTTTQRDNLSSILFDEAAGGMVVYGFANRTVTAPQPYDAKNIILLSDGTCSSACANFVELMHHQAGARTVVVGGLPEAGPMQMPAGNRGGEAYSAFALDDDILFANSTNSTAAAQLPQNRDIDFIITFAGFNLRDAIRKNDPTPLQFQNEPADCRIFYTAPTVYNLENLWNYVIDAMWRNPSLCIAGSASRFDPSTASNSPAAPPSQLSERSTPVSSLEDRQLSTLEENDRFTPPTDTCTVCSNAREVCAEVPFCSSSGRQRFTKQCRRKCAGGFPGDCAHGSHCSTNTRGRSGVCQLDQDIRNSNACRPSGTRQENVQPTAAARGVGVGPYDVPTSGRRRGNNPSRGGFPSTQGTPPSSSRNFGVGGLVNLAFGQV
ncbi:hypothetical protein Q9189_007249 [Teloschistes chrysophthalmus]